MEFVKKFWEAHKIAILTGLLRVGRTAVALAVSLLVAELLKEPSLVALTPVLMGLDKAVREWGN